MHLEDGDYRRAKFGVSVVSLLCQLMTIGLPDVCLRSAAVYDPLPVCTCFTLIGGSTGRLASIECNPIVNCLELLSINAQIQQFQLAEASTVLTAMWLHLWCLTPTAVSSNCCQDMKLLTMSVHCTRWQTPCYLVTL